MTKTVLTALAMLMMAFAIPSTVFGQNSPETMTAAERNAMSRLAYMDGVWKGTSWTLYRSGEKHRKHRTERIGPFLSGSVKVVEGRGYEMSGTVTYDRFGIISYDPAKHAYTLHAYAFGFVQDFAFSPTSDGYTYKATKGPATYRFTAVIRRGQLREVEDRFVNGKKPVRVGEVNLKRVANSTWPAGGAIFPK